MFILIGSRAAKIINPIFREPKDWDIITYIDTLYSWYGRNKNYIISLLPISDHKFKCKMSDGTKIEFEIVEGYESNKLLFEPFNYKTFPKIDFFGEETYVATNNYLWLTKRSHIYWNVHWEKSIRDMHFLKNISTIEINFQEKKYYELRLAENEKKFGKRFVANLNMSNDNFFLKSAKKIKRNIDHDKLHEIVSYYERPLFERFKKDLSKASLDKNLFDNASYEDKKKLVQEEALVIGIERYSFVLLKMKQYKLNELMKTMYRNSFNLAIKRICTNLTSGWFREFVIDNWPNIIVEEEHLQKIHNKIQSII